ncbi:hypothetical protein P7C71_g6558, partial [Lecanoromycetidae sp. Uapishka_2]
MITRLSSLAFGVALLSTPFALCLSPSEIPSDTPVSSLVSSAKSSLAQGNGNDALMYFDAAISRDPHNYLTIFQRGAAYLSLGRNDRASQDFDKVLTIRPDFEGALLQRAKIKSRNADWDAAKEDYVKARKTESSDFAQLKAASEAESLAFIAETEGKWEDCISHAGAAIMVATTSLRLRQSRARCRFELGMVSEAVGDLAHAIQINPSSLEPHLQISAMTFYSMGETDKGIEQMRKCLRSDPDSKACSRLFKREKKLDKTLNKVVELKEKRQFNSAVKLLVGAGEDPGLLQEVKEEVKEGQEAGYIHHNNPNQLYDRLVEMVCDIYTEMNNKKKADPYCTEALSRNPNSLPGLLSKADKQMEAEEYEDAIATLNLAKDHHPDSAQKIQPLLQNAHTLFKRSKTKDYYKIIGVATDADDRQIKRAYRNAAKEYHPDRASAKGVSKEQAEKKMASINEAYEVLSDPELRARFDRGDDPNNPEQQGQPFQGSPFGGGAGGQQFFFRQGGGGGGGFKFQG